MAFRAPLQPLCRTCGRGIKKKTTSHSFGRPEYKRTWDYAVDHPEEAHTKAEAQRYVNEPIVSVRSGYKCITVSTWDGESWEDEFFCTGDCAKQFGYFAMRHPAAETKKYADAMRAKGRR